MNTLIPTRLSTLLLLTATLLLYACGGGGGSSSGGGGDAANPAPAPAPTPAPTPAPEPEPAPEPTPLVFSAPEAARFLSQATYGPTLAEIEEVVEIGPEAWLQEELDKPASLHLENVLAGFPEDGRFFDDNGNPITELLLKLPIQDAKERLGEMQSAGEIRPEADMNLIANNLGTCGWSVIMLWLKGIVSSAEFRNEYVRATVAALAPAMTQAAIKVHGHLLQTSRA